MSNNPIEQLLQFQSDKNEVIAEVANQAVIFSNELVARRLMKEEYQDLMDGLARTALISKQADDLAKFEALKVILLTLAKAALN